MCIKADAWLKVATGVQLTDNRIWRTAMSVTSQQMKIPDMQIQDRDWLTVEFVGWLCL